MNKPYWEIQHDWWVKNFNFEVEQKQEFLLLLRKHPDDNIGEILRSQINEINKRINYLQKEYKKIYGTRFNLNRVKK